MSRYYTKLRDLITVIIIVSLVATSITTSLTLLERANGALTGNLIVQAKAPIATSDDNVYIAWRSNKAGNNEVMFRASNDAGATFAKKINLSNTTGAESVDAEIAASGKNVYVTWWERNQTSNVPVMKISTDNGKSFGQILRLASNDTISNGT